MAALTTIAAGVGGADRVGDESGAREEQLTARSSAAQASTLAMRKVNMLVVPAIGQFVFPQEPERLAAHVSRHFVIDVGKDDQLHVDPHRL